MSKDADVVKQINETLETVAYQLIEAKETMDKLAASDMLARLQAVTSPVPFHARAPRGTVEPPRKARRTVEPIMVKVEDSELDTIVTKIAALIVDRPHTYGELAEALGIDGPKDPKYGKIGSAMMRLRRRKVKPAVNLGSARRAIWWIPSDKSKLAPTQ